MKKAKIALVGYGARGSSLSKQVFTRFLDKLDFVAVCDLYRDRAENGAAFFLGEGCSDTKAFTDYDDILAMKPDAVIIAAAWKVHIPFAIRALEAGIPVALEVGGAYSIEDCFALVEAYERTGTSFMFLENCYYGRLEQMAFRMKELGVFGELVHCEGGYRHDLRSEVATGNEKRHYRFREYATRNCENYPTHEFGPIMKMLDIGHGNRPVRLVSMASKSVGLKAYAAEHYPPEHPANNTSFQQGDIVTTLIECERGETVTITLGTTLPRYYSRGFTVEGTKGALYEDIKSGFIEGVHLEKDFTTDKRFGNIEELYKIYDSELWREYAASPIGTHGGIDYLLFRDYFDCLLSGKPMPIDVYDAAFMMAVTPLSELSIKGGSVPVEFPDFSRDRK